MKQRLHIALEGADKMKITWRDKVMVIKFCTKVNNFCLSNIQGQHCLSQCNLEPRLRIHRSYLPEPDPLHM